MAQRGRCPGGRPSVSANKRSSVSKIGNCTGQWSRYSTLTSGLPESAEHGVGLANGKTTTFGGGDMQSRKGEMPILQNVRARGTAESTHDLRPGNWAANGWEVKE